MTDGPAPFVSRLIMRESVPDEAKDALGQMDLGQLCFTVVAISLLGAVFTIGAHAALDFARDKLREALREEGRSR